MHGVCAPPSSPEHGARRAPDQKQQKEKHQGAEAAETAQPDPGSPVWQQIDRKGRLGRLTRRRLGAEGQPLRHAGVIGKRAYAEHCQRAHAQFLVYEKDADYLFLAKGNQPGLEQLARTKLPGDFPPGG
jgi:hypothetical protein